ncbi:hypothetical protein BH11PSE11_BH11PSE11_13510 [soil metagenome]
MKNPFMSIFLSNANRVAGTIRGHASAAINREAAKNTRQMTKAWTEAFSPPSLTTRKKSKARK